MRDQLSLLLGLLRALKVQEARDQYRSLEQQLNREEKRDYHDELDEALNRAYRLLKEMINKGNLEYADYVFTECGSFFHSKQLAELKRLGYLTRDNKLYSQDDRRKRQQIREALEASKFLDADQLYFSDKDTIEKHSYEQLKSKYIKLFFRKLDHKFSTDTEKADAVAKIAQNVQIKARAGSGKTTTLAFKTAFLIDHYQVDPKNIMILAFNKEAALEIMERITNKYGYRSFKNARTFHSFARQIVQPKEELLVDEDDNKKQQLHLEECIKYLEKREPDFKGTLYKFFRAEVEQLDTLHENQADDDYDNRRNRLNYEEHSWRGKGDIIRRSRRYPTLSGVLVKSQPEKYIADFFFEHGIGYAYERYFSVGSKEDRKGYHPDFTFTVDSKKFALEHWGINEDDPNKATPEGWTKTFDEYVDEMQWKRKYWQEKKSNYTLLETSPRDIDYTETNVKKRRRGFEEKLKLRLKEHGISCQKLIFEDLYRKVVIREGEYKIRLLNLFLGFINKAKQLGWSVDDTKEKVDQHQPMSERERAFLRTAQAVYLEYEKRRKERGKIDFNDLLKKAEEKVQENQGRCLVGEKEKEVSLNDLKWLLIDEFQDFSRAFYKLVESARKFNPNLRLVVVGDDWQAINGFAGSDLSYFSQFSKKYSPSDSALLQTNFRSHKKIVDLGNAFMEGLGPPSKAFSSKRGEVLVCFIEDVWIEESEQDKQFGFIDSKDAERSKSAPKDIVDFSAKARYLKLCFEIICKHFEDDPTVEIDVLSRTQTIGSGQTKLDDFKVKLIECLEKKFIERDMDIDFSEAIRVETVHKMKGKEADVVLILEATDRKFPLLHPNNELNQIFGQTVETSYDEEKRLFYVAITRAKETLYFLTERGRESEFISNLV